MKNYYLNTNTTGNPNGNNEVHTGTCQFLPAVHNRRYLGLFSNGVQAVQYAKNLGYSKADGCAVCCPEAHKG